MKFPLKLILLLGLFHLHKITSQKNNFLAWNVQEMSVDYEKYHNFVDALGKIVSATQPKIMSLISISYPKDHVEKGTYFMVNELLRELPLNVKYRVQDFDHLPIMADSLVKIRPRFYNVIFLNDFKEFVESLLPHFKKLVFDHRGYYVIVLPNILKWSANDIKRLMEVFWSVYVVNLNILLQDVDGTILSMTYFPFGEGYCEEVQPVVSNKYQNGTFDSWIHFPMKLRQFHGCPLTVAVTNVPPFVVYENETSVGGIEGNIIQILSKNILNFTTKIVVSNKNERQGKVYPNGTVTGGLKLLYGKKANLSIGFYTIRGDYLTYFDMTSVIFAVKLQFLATVEAPRSSPMELIWIAFQAEVWLLLALSLVIGIVLICILKCRPQYQRDFIIGRGMKTPILNLIAILFGNPLTRLPTTNFARTILIYFFLFTFVLRNAYLGSLYEVAQRDPAHVDSLKEMLQKNFTFYAATLTKPYMDAVPQLRNKVVYVLPNEDTYMRVTNGTLIPGSKKTVLSTQFHIFYLNRLDKRQKMLRPIKDDLALVSLAFCLPKQSLLTRIVSRYISQMAASGLVTMSIRKNYNRDYLTVFKDQHEPKQMTMSDVSGIFDLLIGGLLLSFLVFIGEILYHKIFK